MAIWNIRKSESIRIIRGGLHVYEVRKIILILFNIVILLYYTNDLICTTGFASLLHKSLLENNIFLTLIDFHLYHTNSRLNRFFEEDD